VAPWRPEGLAVLLLCFALLSLLHQDLTTVVDRLMSLLRINPDSHFADLFYEMADRTTGRGIWTAFTVGLLYSACALWKATACGISACGRSGSP